MGCFVPVAAAQASLTALFGSVCSLSTKDVES